MKWTDERVAMLTKLWAEGLSASQIAKQLGGVTRNAVIGKVHRLGLSGRAKPSSPARKAAAAKTAAAAARRAAGKTAAPRKRAKPAAKTAAPATAEAATRAPSAPPKPKMTVQELIKTPPLEAKPLANGEFATILTLTDHMCKWPIGDPGAESFRFCGRKTDPEEPYCLAHSRVAYQPSRRRGASSNTKALGPQPTSRKRLR
jgi:GcrA cell cycle regulator